MKYLSTRGTAPSAPFEDVLLAGLAPDGGLYVPESWPQVSAQEIASFRHAPYSDAAASIISHFTGNAFSRNRLTEISAEIYTAFDHKDVAPLTKVDDQDWILELYHGPTLAFKDFAMQMLGKLYDEELARRGKQVSIIVATSGDTGAAAIEALKSCENVSITVLHPEGRVTDVQRKMMTSVTSGNVCNVAIDGSFDDCQAIVKHLFSDQSFVADVNLSGVNSINWGRIASQIVYYFTAAASIGFTKPLNFVVPTGNFGDIYAGYVAKKMGLPIEKLIVSTNANDILHRAISTGDYSPASVQVTHSPSMDIQVASNFERLLFDAMDRDPQALSDKMAAFQTTGSMTLSNAEQTVIQRDFGSFATSEEATLAEIKRHHDETGMLIDPHTAVSRVAAQNLRANNALSGNVVTLSTAHPAKFPDAVKRATGKHPELPAHYADLFDRPEHMVKAAADPEAIKALLLDRHR